MRPMRIAMIGFRGIPHTYGGNEEFIRHLGPRLAARGHEINVYSRSRYFPDREPVWQGVRRTFYPAPEHKSLGQFTHAALATLDAAVRRPDVIFIQTLPSAPFAVVPWMLGQRVVINVNGMEWGRDKWGPVGKAYFRAAARISVRTATAIVNDSDAMRGFYRDRFGRDSYFIPYGAELRHSTEPERVRAFGVEPRKYFLVVSRFVPENNVDLIIDAYAKSGAKLPMMVVGSANYDDEWVRALHARASDRVRFVGHVADPQTLAELHCNSFAYVHGHSLGGTNPSLLTALGGGECVIALDNPFNREVLVDARGVEYGLLFPKQTTALAKLFADLEASPPRAEELRSRARDRIRDAYTWESVTDRYEAMFAEVVSRGGRGKKLP